MGTKPNCTKRKKESEKRGWNARYAVYVHALGKTKTNHVLVILIIAGCRSLRHVFSFIKPLERRLGFFCYIFWWVLYLLS